MKSLCGHHRMPDKLHVRLPRSKRAILCVITYRCEPCETDLCDSHSQYSAETLPYQRYCACDHGHTHTRNRSECRERSHEIHLALPVASCCLSTSLYQLTGWNRSLVRQIIVISACCHGRKRRLIQQVTVITAVSNRAYDRCVYDIRVLSCVSNGADGGLIQQICVLPFVAYSRNSGFVDFIVIIRKISQSLT